MVLVEETRKIRFAVLSGKKILYTMTVVEFVMCQRISIVVFPKRIISIVVFPKRIYL